jgi:hypothetical protein
MLSLTFAFVSKFEGGVTRENRPRRRAISFATGPPSSWAKAPLKQCDQIGRIFANWVSVNFGLFFENL